MKRAIAASLVALFALFASGIASAGLFRAYLSLNGKDTNPCTVQQPCRLLPAALAAINDGGEVWMLDSANFNTGNVSVTKSVTILAIPGAVGSLITPQDADGLTINVNGGRVTLRNLIVRDLNGPGFAIAGIRVASGTIGSVRIENCEVYGVDIGIALDAGLTTIVNTSIHDTGDFGVAVAIGELAADALSVSNTSTAVSAEEGAHVTISNSTLTENNIAIRAFGTAATATVVDVARTTIASTKGTGVQIGANGGTVAEVFLHSTTVHANIGFNFLGVGGTEKIFSYGDNRLVFYAASTQGGSLTPISGI